MKNKFLSVLLVLSILMTAIPAAYADAPSNTVIESVTNDAWLGSGSGATVYPSETYLRVAKNMNQTAMWKNTAIAALAWDVSDVFDVLESNPGYVVKSVKMCATTYYWGSAPNLKLNLYNIDTRWSESDEDGCVTFTSGNKTKILPIDPSNVDAPVFLRKPDLILDGTYDLRASEGTQKTDVAEEYDITALFRLHQVKNQGSEVQNFFSFAIDSVADSGNYEFNIRTKEHGTPAALVVEYSLLEEMTALDVSLPSDPADDLKVTYNNPVSDVKIKVNGSDVTEGISVSGVSIDFDYPFENNTLYLTDISATDIYGQTSSETYPFVVSRKAVSEAYVASSSSLITSSGPAAFPGMGASAVYYGKDDTKNSIVVYGFELPTADEGYIENAVFRFWSTSSADGDYKRVYEFDGDWVLSGDDAITSLDEPVADIIDNYDNYAIRNVKCTSNRGEYYSFDVNITSYVNRLLSEGRSGTAYIAVCTYGQDSGKYVRKDPDSSIASYANPFLLTDVNLSPEIYCTNKAFEIEGDVLKALSFRLTTLFDKEVIENGLSVKDESGNILDEAVFCYDSDSSTVYLESEIPLDSGKSYTIVIDGGIEDKFFNLLSSDMVVTAFSASENVPVKKNPDETIKCIYSSETEELYVIYANSLYHNRMTRISLLDNETGDTVFEDIFQSDENGMLTFTLEAVAPDISYTLHIYPENAPSVSYIDVLNDAYRNYIWKIAASSKDAVTVYEKLDVICSGFDLKIGYSEYINDITDFCKKLTSTRDYYRLDTEYSEAENEKLSDVFDRLGLFTALETFEPEADEEAYGALFDNALALCSDDFSKKLSVLKKEEYDFYSKMYEEFLDTEKVIDTVSDFEESVYSIYKKMRADEILSKLAAATHLSEVNVILSDEETASVFPIEEIIKDYKNLKSTEDVDKALYKKEFASADEFVKVLKSSVEKAVEDENDDDDTSSSRPSSGKGGSGSMGSVGFSPIIAPSVPDTKVSFDDLNGYDWAKDYIILLSGEGIINGRGEGMFAPGDNVLREEVAKMLVGEFKLTPSNGDGSFSDVSQTAWYSPYVYSVKAAGIANGISDSLFGTGTPITRQDAAVMLSNALEAFKSKITTGAASYFADFDSVAPYAREAVEYMASIGVINGYSDNTFAPYSPITRAEFAVMLGRVHQMIN